MSGNEGFEAVDLSGCDDAGRQRVAAWLAWYGVPHRRETWASLSVPPDAVPGVRQVAAEAGPAPALGTASSLPGRVPGTAAELGQRVVATLVDGLVFLPFVAGLLVWQFANRLPNGNLPRSPSGYLLAAAAFHAVYLVGCLALWGRTVGNRATGTVVVSASDRRAIGFRQAVVRWATLSWVSALAAVFPGVLSRLGLLWFIVVIAPVVAGRPQGLHDRAAGTLVVVAGHGT